MADQELTIRINADSDQAKKAIAEMQAQFAGLNARLNAFRQQAGRELIPASATASIERNLVTSFRAAQREGEGLFTVLTQLRIGLTQVGRGDVGGLPNLIKAYRDFSGAGKEAETATKLLDAALTASGVTSTRAADLFGEFTERVKTGISGSGAEARALRRDFELLGIDLTRALLQPDQAFAQLLKRFGEANKGSAEFDAGLNLLGASAGKVEQAAGTAGRSLATLSSGLGAAATGALALGAVIGGAVVVGLLAAAAAVALVKAEADLIIGKAREIGTKSKEDFDKFRKAIELAGGKVTELDRALAQGITREVERIKGAADGLFVQLVRQTGPQLIVLLRDVAVLIQQLQPLVSVIGSIFLNSFAAASAVVRTLQQDVFLLKQGLAGVVIASDPVLQAKLLAANFQKAKEEAQALVATLPKATFTGGRGGQQQRDTIADRIRLLELEERAAQRTFRTETTEAERSYRQQGISFQTLTDKLIAAEQKLLAVKLNVIAQERALIGQSKDQESEKTLKLAELREQELAALNDYATKIRDLQERIANDQDKRTREQLEREKAAYQARLTLLRQLRDLQQQIDETRLERRQGELEQARAVPGNEREELEQTRQLLLEEARLRSERRQVEIQDQLDELVLSEQTAAEKFQIEQRLNNALLAEDSRFRAEKLRIQQEFRAQELELQGFDSGQAAAIAAQEAILERQLTILEQVRVAMRATIKELKAQLPSAAALITQSFIGVSRAIADTVKTFVQSGGTLRQAAGAIVSALLQPYATYASNKSIIAAIESAEAFLRGDFASGAKWAGISAAWAGLSGLLGGLGGRIANAGNSGGGALGASLTGTRQSDATRATEDRVRFTDRNGLETNIRITLVTDQDQQVKNVSTAFRRDYDNNGTVRQVLDNHSSGIPVG